MKRDWSGWVRSRPEGPSAPAGGEPQASPKLGGSDWIRLVKPSREPTTPEGSGATGRLKPSEWLQPRQPVTQPQPSPSPNRTTDTPRWRSWLDGNRQQAAPEAKQPGSAPATTRTPRVVDWREYIEKRTPARSGDASSAKPGATLRERLGFTLRSQPPGREADHAGGPADGGAVAKPNWQDWLQARRGNSPTATPAKGPGEPGLPSWQDRLQFKRGDGGEGGPNWRGLLGGEGRQNARVPDGEPRIGNGRNPDWQLPDGWASAWRDRNRGTLGTPQAPERDQQRWAKAWSDWTRAPGRGDGPKGPLGSPRAGLGWGEDWWSDYRKDWGKGKYVVADDWYRSDRPVTIVNNYYRINNHYYGGRSWHAPRYHWTTYLAWDYISPGRGFSISIGYWPRHGSHWYFAYHRPYRTYYHRHYQHYPPYCYTPVVWGYYPSYWYYHDYYLDPWPFYVSHLPDYDYYHYDSPTIIYVERDDDTYDQAYGYDDDYPYYPEGVTLSLGTALRDIALSWLTQDTELLARHLSNEREIEARDEAAGYDRVFTAVELEDLVSIAFDNIETERFYFTDVDESERDAAWAEARHLYREDGQTREAYIHYHLYRDRGEWYVDAIMVQSDQR